MLDQTEALDLVTKHLAERTPFDQVWVIDDKDTIETLVAWIFFHNSKQFADTGDPRSSLAGNGPVFVNKRTGAVKFYGSTPALKTIIEDYEKALT